MKIEQLREELIKDVTTYLDEVRLPFVNKSDKQKKDDMYKPFLSNR